MGRPLDSRATFNRGGRAFPRFSALLSIPSQAVRLKKNLCGISPVSRMSDSEDSTASLGDSKVLSVKNSPRDMIPAFLPFPENKFEVLSAIRRKTSGDVLPEKPLWPNFLENSKIFSDEARSAIQSFSFSGD